MPDPLYCSTAVENKQKQKEIVNPERKGQLIPTRYQAAEGHGPLAHEVSSNRIMIPHQEPD